MAAAMLAASRDGSGRLPKQQQAEQAGALVMPSSFGLGPGSTPEEEALVLSFGQSHLAFSMQPQVMRSLGESMLAISERHRAS